MHRLILILGMHRSGTSCVTHMLQRAGLYLGTDLMDGESIDNLEGHGESREALRINEEILRLSGGAWDRVPESLESTDEVREQMRRFLAGLRTQLPAGWKEPRTTLTFPIWKPELGEYRIVGCFRHPLAVARSLQVRSGMALKAGLELWTAYNERLLEYLEAEADYHLIDFDLEPALFVESVRQVCRDLGLGEPGTGDKGFNPFLRHQRGAGEIADPHVNALYAQLQALARPAAARLTLLQAEKEDDSNRWQHLARATELQNQMLQKLYLSLDHTRRRLLKVEEEHRRARLQMNCELQRVLQQNQYLTEKFQLIQSLLSRLRGSLLFRLVRGVGRLVKRVGS
jgi:hypothetical protein